MVINDNMESRALLTIIFMCSNAATTVDFCHGFDGKQRKSYTVNVVCEFRLVSDTYLRNAYPLAAISTLV